MDLNLYAKVKESARYCRDREVRRKLYLFLEVIRSGEVLRSCHRYGIAVSSYYHWWNRYRGGGYEAAALKLKSRRPKRSPRQISGKLVRKIKRYRIRYRYGPKRIAYWLEKEGIKVSESAIRHAIERHGWILRRYRTKQVNPHRKRYELPDPGHLQVDIKYVPGRVNGEQWYVYNAIDDYSRWRYAKAYRAINAKHSVEFVEDLVKAAPFEILSVQTDNDVAFTNRLSPWWQGKCRHLFDLALESYGIEHRLIPPGMKELNGKVERSHRIDDEEFYWKANLSGFEAFQEDLTRWIYSYNHHRPHSALGHMSPMQKLVKRLLMPALVAGLRLKELWARRPRPLKMRVNLDTYRKYLDWIQSDPFHFQDVRDFYIKNAVKSGPSLLKTSQVGSLWVGDQIIFK